MEVKSRSNVVASSRFRFCRAQIKNVGLKPFTAQLKENRAKALSAKYPQYSAHYLNEFVETQPMYETIFNK